MVSFGVFRSARVSTCRVRTRTSSSLLTVWGALEQIFAPSAGELRYRVAANLAAYLEPRGPKRLAAYKHVLQLYNERSTAAHTAAEGDWKALLSSWVILRNALMKMIREGHVPSQVDFEQILFVDSSAPAPEAASWAGLSRESDKV
jgi:hypothetical protein